MDNQMGNKSSSSAGNYGHAIKYLGIFGGAQGLSVLLGMLRNKVASVLLGTVGFGVIALYSRTVQLFCDTTGLSLSLSAVRRMSDVYSNEDHEAVRHCVKVVRSIALLTGLAGMLLMMLCSPLLSQWMFDGAADCTWRLLFISPVVLFMAVSGGELAVLRGVKQPGRIAFYTLWTAVSATLVTVPLYCLLGMAGIIPTIFLVALLQMAGALYFSTTLYPYRAKPFSRALLREGVDIVKLGAGYIYTTVLVSVSLWYVYQAVTRIGGEDATGLFSAGYILVGMLPSILFAAFDSDYYPRLSGIFTQKSARNAMVNEHIEVHLLVQMPVILCVIMLLPWLFPLFFSAEFLPALPMAQIALFALLFHVVTYPISFMPVSKGDTLTFAVQETIYNAAFVLLTLLGFAYYGWVGAGVGMMLARIIDLLVVYSIANSRYGFCLSGRAVSFLVMAVVAGCVVLGSALGSGCLSWLRYVGAGVAVAMASISMYRLSRHSNIFSSVFNRILKRFR
jgi:O-antigen/teichoic acid export membrane protein